MPHLVGQRFYGGSADSSEVRIVRAEPWQFGGVWLTVESAGALYRTLVDATGRDLLAQYAAEGDDAAGAGVGVDVVGYVRALLAEHGHTLVGDVQAQRVGGEQSNTSFVVGSWVVKFQRRLSEGVSPEVLVADALADCPHAAHVVAHDEGACVATVVPLVDGARDGWELALERGLVGDDSGEGIDVAGLGAAIARVHAALDVGHVQRREDLLDSLRERMVRTGTQAGLGGASKTGLLEVLANAGAGDDQVPVQRVHGDLHLGQVLWDSYRWVLIDFEGEPAATPAERAAEHSPMKDLAGMIRSFDYATEVRTRENAASGSTAADAGTGVVEQATQALLDGYRQAGGTVDEALLQAYLLDKALYEYDYELHYRPDFCYIPARALKALGIATPE
ncbi:phosphotransferase [Corynebacterium argentoratense]|uniref:phosphotransferase n=1 Tax=Corynebacterium argentoratense TaxID=42817 RepID=UPI00248E9ED2|nr:phosphotransferase [Corynebacterium argentoratense]